MRKSISFALGLALPLVLGLALALALPLAAPVHAQVAAAADTAILGRVVDQGSRVGIPAVAVVHLDAGGNQVEGAFTDSIGGFRLRVPAGAGHLLVVERLGYAPLLHSFESAPGLDAEPLLLALASRPIELRGITVSAEKQCEIDPGAGDQTQLLWETARTGLRAAALTASEGLILFRVDTWARVVDGRGAQLEVLADSTVDMTGVPFGTADPDSLATNGYVRTEGDSVIAYGPDARILLSDSFLSTHCFEVAGRHADEPNQIGLSFEPVPGRTVPDIAGTLWIDVGTGELRSVEFDYVQDGVVYLAGSGGRIEFRVLEAGPWVVESWRLRMMVGRSRNETRFHESGGSLLEVLSGNAAHRW